MNAAVPSWEAHGRRLRHALAEHGADLVGQVAWLAALGALVDLVPTEAWVTGVEQLVAADTVVLALGGVGLVAAWTLTTVLHEATHAVALHSRGVRADVTVKWWRIRGYRLPIASSGVCRPRGDGYARLTPTEHIRVATAPAALAAVLSVLAAAGGLAVGGSPLTVGVVVALMWLFGGPSPSDWGRVVDALLWPDEYRKQANRQAARIREHAAVEGADPRMFAPTSTHQS